MKTFGLPTCNDCVHRANVDALFAHCAVHNMNVPSYGSGCDSKVTYLEVENEYLDCEQMRIDKLTGMSK